MKTNKWFCADYKALIIAFCIQLFFFPVGFNIEYIIRTTIILIILMFVERVLWPGNFLKP